MLKKELLTIIMMIIACSSCHAQGNDLSISFNEKKSAFIVKNNTPQLIFYDESLFSVRPPRGGYLELAIKVNDKNHEKYCTYADSLNMPRKLTLKPGRSASISISLHDFEGFRCIGKGQKYQVSFEVKGKKNLESNRITLIGNPRIYTGKP